MRPIHTLSDLANPALLSLAAKKAYQFLDRHSWYFDRAEAAAFLGRLSFNVWRLSAEIETGDYFPAKKLLFAAPKKIITKANDEKKYVVRPLATYSFRDQIVETALLCLFADDYEPLWGDIREPAYPANVSFGNRLHSIGNNNSSEFSIGSSRVYRDWSEDYTAFVQGTEAAFNNALRDIQQGDNVTLLCCDVKSFYPSIRREALLKRVKATSDKGLARMLERVFGSYEVESSAGLPDREARKLATMGLPQGGVHSGFWANVYLSDFDQWITQQLQENIRGKLPGFRLRYYARYVDDMRIIGTYRSPLGAPYKRAKAHPLYGAVSSKLSSLGLKLSPEKSQLIQQKAGGPLLTTGQVAERMHTIHQRLYFPMPPEDLQELAKDLRLLFHADVQSPEGGGPHLDNPGVRRDSRWRFSAGRWLRVAKELEGLKPGWIKTNGVFSSEIVRRWLEKPEQVQLLLYALRIGIGPLENAAIHKKMLRLSQDKTAFGYQGYLKAFFLEQASRSELNAISLSQLPLRSWAFGILQSPAYHPVMRNKARQYLLTSTKLNPSAQIAFLRGRRDGYCEILQSAREGNEPGMLHPSEIASIYAFHSFRRETQSHLISATFERSEMSRSKKLLRQLLLAIKNKDTLSDIIKLSRKHELAIPELAVFKKLRKRRSGSNEELLMNAILRGEFVAPLQWCRLATALCALLEENNGERLARRGLIHPQSIKWSAAHGLRLIPSAHPNLAFVGYADSFTTTEVERFTPAWSLPIGMLLHAAASRDPRDLLGISASQRFKTLSTFKSLLGKEAMLPEAAGKIITRLYAWPGSRLIPFRSVGAFKRAVSSLESDLEGLTTKGPLVTTLCDVEGPKPTGKNQKFTVVICQTPSHPEIVSDITVRRALSVARTIGLEHGDGVTSPSLVIFPELSVPVASLPTLRRFVQATNAMVLAGLELRTSAKPKRQINELVWIIPGDEHDTRPLLLRQHKIHLTKDETKLSPPVLPANPAIIWRVGVSPKRLAAINCYEFTDLALRDLVRGRIEALMIAANNRDVPTFDTLVEASHYDLFCHVILVNAERFGGSAIRAPYKEAHERRIFDVHGGDLFAVNVCDLDLAAFRGGPSAAQLSSGQMPSRKPIKTTPAGFVVR